MGKASALGGAFLGPVGGMVGAAYDSSKQEEKAAKRTAAAQEKAAREAAEALKSQSTPATAKVADTGRAAQRQAAQRAALAGVRSTYTAGLGGGSATGMKTTLGA